MGANEDHLSDSLEPAPLSPEAPVGSAVSARTPCACPARDAGRRGRGQSVLLAAPRGSPPRHLGHVAVLGLENSDPVLPAPGRHLRVLRGLGLASSRQAVWGLRRPRPRASSVTSMRVTEIRSFPRVLRLSRISLFSSIVSLVCRGQCLASLSSVCGLTQGPCLRVLPLLWHP